MRMFSKSLSQDETLYPRNFRNGVQRKLKILPQEQSTWTSSNCASSFCLHQIVVHHTQHTKAAGPFAVLGEVKVKARLQPILVAPSLPVLKTSQMLCNHAWKKPLEKKPVATVCCLFWSLVPGKIKENTPRSSEPGILHQKGFWHCHTIEDQAHWPHSSGAKKCWNKSKLSVKLSQIEKRLKRQTFQTVLSRKKNTKEEKWTNTTKGWTLKIPKSDGKLWLCSEMIEQSVCPWNFCKHAINGVLSQRYSPASCLWFHMKLQFCFKKLK